MHLPQHPRPLTVNTASQPASCRLSRLTPERLHEVKRRTGLGIDAIVFALVTEALREPAP
jgi:hypothetical protein